MKKLIAILLAAVMVFGLAACGTINDAEVSILWADKGVVEIPNSLINAMERAMYTKSIAYAHYGANGDQAAQTKQAEEALNKGCAALLVNLVDPAAAQTIVDLAKAKNVPVVFFDCEADAAVLASADKCALVNTDAASVAGVQGQQIGEYLVKNWDKVDHDGNGKITYIYIADEGAADPVKDVNTVLTGAGKTPLVKIEAADSSAVINGCTEESRAVELIITGSDEIGLKTLTALQEKGYNSTRLTTHCIPLFTVGTEADARAFKNTANMTEEEKAELVYTATDLIGSGFMAGSAVEDLDAVAAAVAAITANLLKGNDAFSGVENAKDKKVLVPYTTV